MRGTSTPFRFARFTASTLPSPSAVAVGSLAVVTNLGNRELLLKNTGSFWVPTYSQLLYCNNGPVTHTGTVAATTIATTGTIPGGFFHANSILRFSALVARTAGTGTITIAFSFGSTTIQSTSTSSASLNWERIVTFANSQSSQRAHTIGNIGGTPSYTNLGGIATTSINFGADQTLNFIGTLSADTITLTAQSLLIEWVR